MNKCFFLSIPSAEYWKFKAVKTIRVMEMNFSKRKKHINTIRPQPHKEERKKPVPLFLLDDVFSYCFSLSRFTIPFWQCILHASYNSQGNNNYVDNANHLKIILT